MLGLIYLASLAAAGSAIYYFATQNGSVRKNPVQPPVITVPENEAVDALKKRIGDLEDKNRELWEELNEEEKNGK